MTKVTLENIYQHQSMLHTDFALVGKQ